MALKDAFKFQIYIGSKFHQNSISPEVIQSNDVTNSDDEKLYKKNGKRDATSFESVSYWKVTAAITCEPPSKRRFQMIASQSTYSILFVTECLGFVDNIFPQPNALIMMLYYNAMAAEKTSKTNYYFIAAIKFHSNFFCNTQNSCNELRYLNAVFTIRSQKISTFHPI